MTEITESAGELGRKLVADMERITWNRNGAKILANVRRNARYRERGQSLAALRDQPLGAGHSAIVIAAGPSIKRRDPICAIKKSGYAGTIIATDSAVAYCLRNNIVPHLVVSLDPDATRIVRWFGDPHLTEEALEQDDYFRRQDMDTAFADELRTNREVMALMDRHGKDMRVALCTSASEAVTNRILETGMRIYWWNPMLDDPNSPGSVTRKLLRKNGLPCVNAGGNVGAACWMMAHAVLGKKEVALTGMDFSYYSETPYKNTQYYNEAVLLVGEEGLDAIFMEVHNPYLKTRFYTDPAYMWYREAFLDMATEAGCKTYNCTESGILFGDPIVFVPLAEFLAKHT